MNLGTTTEDEVDKEPLIMWFSLSIVVGWIAGYVTSDVLKELGYTHRITAEVVGGGQSTTIYPIAGEWYGGMLGAVVMLLVFGGWCIWAGRKNEQHRERP